MKKIIYILAALMSIAFVACEQNETAENNILLPENPDDLYAKTEFNLDMRDFAMAVSNAMNNSKDFRKLIKKEALAKFDGDYDVLLSRIMNETVKVDNATNSLRSETSYSVEDLLNDYYVSSDTAKLRATTPSVIGSLSSKYPDLQVSVPVHAEKLNEDSVLLLTFIPAEYEDGVTKTLPGYDLNGNQVKIDAINAPDKPVIVIGLNERINRCSPQPASKPSAPANLTATQTTNGIQLAWVQTVTGAGKSNPKYDFIQVPYRNPAFS